MADLGVYDAILRVATTAPDRTCLVFDDGTSWTYGDLDARAASFAGVLDALGVATGDRVAVQVDKSGDAVALYLACLRQGVVFLPLNTAYTPEEVAYFTDDAQAALFVGRPDHPAPATVPSETLGGDGTDGCTGTLTQPLENSAGFRSESGLDPAENLGRVAPPPPVHRSGDDLAALLYTSGTTGRSKGAMLSCRNLTANARALTDTWHFEPDDVLVHVLPIFHVHGLFVALHCAFLAGAAVRFHTRFDVEAVRRDLRRSTVMMGVPTHYHRLLADPGFGGDDCASMRLFTSGSAPLAADRHQEFADRTGHRIIERYGMTETMILTSNPYDDGPDGRGRVAGTVGFALPGVEMRVVDDHGVPVSPGKSGTVEVQGDGVCLGYWNRPDLPVGPGWFSTGDIGVVDESGRLTLAGRVGDMIISGGLNIYPAEIERVLDAVDGVTESAVIGVPDADFGEAVVAVVVADPLARPTPESLDAACASLARFKQPGRYEVVDELPRNTMGKVQKTLLRERFS